MLLADRQRFASSGDGVKQAERRYRRPTQAPSNRSRPMDRSDRA